MTKVWNRRLQPLALGLTLTMIIIAQANVRGIDRGTEPPISYVVAIIAITSALLMIVGWISRRQRMIEWALLGVVFTYTARAVFIMFYSPWDQAVFFSIATVLMAGGAYYLEADERQSRERRG
jgi:hypothetical protein